ncbi:MAG TPA: sialidase family protein [Oscillospiraceae bacterium]|nr:sialidase family protein [Oscillospiraceae bacterium]HPK35667.1 sialidase family protein [Oscillospiraceae bacterium]HPR75795.1 sialidase family protein [Oscillospiraceae bacterium]
MQDQKAPSRVKLELGEPVVIAQAPPLPSDQDNWGICQFPRVELLEGGKLHCEYHIGKDSAHAYGKPKGHAMSEDSGITWTECDNPGGGVPLSDGRYLNYKIVSAFQLSDVKLPEEPDGFWENYGWKRNIYKIEKMPEEFRLFPFEITEKDGTLHTVWKRIEVPGMTAYTSEGVLPRPAFWRIRKAPNGRLWAIGYPFFLGEKRPANSALFCVSDDDGESFNFLSRIPFEPDPIADYYYRVRGGFGEPDICFLPDGSVFCLLRTTDGNGIGPSYFAKSFDGGKTWSKPAVFDNNGVWPCLCALKNGVTLASYGRPGLFLRASADEQGLAWDDRIEIIPPGRYQTDTCSYSEMVALSENEAFIVYSDFAYPNADGVRVKTILGRKIKAEKA